MMGNAMSCLSGRKKDNSRERACRSAIHPSIYSSSVFVRLLHFFCIIIGCCNSSCSPFSLQFSIRTPTDKQLMGEPGARVKKPTSYVASKLFIYFFICLIIDALPLTPRLLLLAAHSTLAALHSRK